MKKTCSLLVLCIFVFMCGCSQKQTVTLDVEIDCSEILAEYDMLDEALKSEKYVPSDGKILKKTSITVEKGADALTVLKKAADEHNIQIDYSDGYVKAINYLYEKSCGEMSGWVYEANEQQVWDYSASDGDFLLWKFVCSFE